MPLAFLEEPDIGTLRRTFMRMQSEMNLMQNSKAFSEMMPDEMLQTQSMNDFAIIEDENHHLRTDIDQMEQVFAQTDNQFFSSQRETLEMESQFEGFQQQAEVEIAQLTKVVESKE